MEFFFKYFRACPLCHTSFKPVKWLCDLCESKVMDQVRDHRRWIDNTIEHHYLFEWKPGDQQLSKLVRSLKGWGFSKPYEIFSKIILNHIYGSGFDSSMGSFRKVSEDSAGQSPVSVNSPLSRIGPGSSRKTNGKIPEGLFYPSGGRKDHALMLAQKLGNLMGLSPQPLIKQKTTLKQALLKRRERQSIEIKKSSWKESGVLLVDDVVTTGSTVRACYKALNQPSKLVVWSLFYRRSL